MAEEIGPIGGDVDDDLLIGDRNRFEKWRPWRSLRVELENPLMIHAQAKLLGRTQHAVRFDAADLAAVELEAAGERRADRSKRVGLSRLDIRSTADDLERRCTACIHLTQRK